MKKIVLPLQQDSVLEELHSGDEVLVSGSILCGRDQVHIRFVNLIKEGKELPVDLKNQGIYYVGPTPAPAGKVIGSAGPTTSSRMDKLTIPLLEKGLKIMIGKGNRACYILEACKKFKAVYLAAIGGAGAYLSKCIKKVEELAYSELGTESLKRFHIEDFPTVVAFDVYGNTIYSYTQST
ncbi:MAG: FumA C-terminus/TtdB family hydratase beta subunit [Planctomycetota bacterium]